MRGSTLSQAGSFSHQEDAAWVKATHSSSSCTGYVQGIFPRGRSRAELLPREGAFLLAFVLSVFSLILAGRKKESFLFWQGTGTCKPSLSEIRRSGRKLSKPLKPQGDHTADADAEAVCRWRWG